MDNRDATQTSRAGAIQAKLLTQISAGLALLLLGATPISARRSGATSAPPITPEILVANNCSRDVTVYPLGSNGDVAPLGPVPAFSAPSSVAVDGQNNLYVLDGCTGAIEVFAPGSSGNTAPITAIGGDNSGFSSDLAVDRSGDIYAVQFNYAAPFNGVALFASGSNGNVSPTAVISGPDTGLDLSAPFSIAVDPSGKIYVATLQGGKGGNSASAAVYAPGSVGDAKPIATISGPDTGLPPCCGRFGFPSIGADSKGQIYVVNSGFEDPGGILPDVPSAIMVYSPGSNGDAKPIHTITGPDTGLHHTGFGATDSGGNLYVANFSVRSSRLQPLTTTATVEVFAPGSDGDASPSTVISGPDTSLAAPGGLALDTSGNIYVADTGYQGAIHVYAAGSNGDVAPTLTLGGPSTAPFFRSPIGAAVDGKGNFYVLSTGLPANAIDVYPAGSKGAGPPIATISGPHTGLQDYPSAIAVDSKGTIYVANCDVGCHHPSVIEYRPGAKGDARPFAVISGRRTGLQLPTGIAVGPNGFIYVLTGSVTVFRPGSKGNVKPYATIAGGNTGLANVSNIAVDSCSRVYVGQQDSSSNEDISVFAPRKFGNIAPVAVISGPDTGLANPTQVAVDSSGKIYVANGGNVLVYAPGSNGDSTPLAVIAGPHTGLGGPIGIAIAEPPPAPHSHPSCQ